MKKIKTKIYAICVTLLFFLTVGSTMATAVRMPGKEAMNMY